MGVLVLLAQSSSSTSAPLDFKPSRNKWPTASTVPTLMRYQPSSRVKMPAYFLMEREILTEQTFTLVMHFLDVLYKLWPIVVGVAVVAIVWYRTRSLFFLFHQILKWLGLEGKYTNAEDQEFADVYLDLNKFNLKTGFHLKSAKAKTALHVWAREHDLEFADLKRAGWFFKANQLKFDTPNIWQASTRFVLMAALALAFLTGSQFVDGDDYVLLKVKATDTWFWVGNNEAYSPRFNFPDWVRGEPWRLQQGDCRYVEDSIPMHDIWDKDVICRLLLGLNDGFISDATASQEKAAWVLRVFGAGCLVFLIFDIFWLAGAKALQATLMAKASSADIISNTKAASGSDPLPVSQSWPANKIP